MPLILSGLAKKTKKLFIIFLVVPFFILAVFIIYLFIRKQAITPSIEENKEETLAEKQLKELEELRQRANIQPLTEEQKQAQIKELEALRKKANVKPLTQKQVQAQLEELERLRLGSY